MPRTWPYEFHDAFEDGTTNAWSEGATTDADHTADVAHYTDLARFDMTPHSGAYCYRFRLNGTGAGSSFLDDTWVNASGSSVSCLFRFYIGKDFAFTADDLIPFIKLVGTGDVDAVRIFFDCTAAFGIEIKWGTTTDTYASGAFLERGRWYALEVTVDLDASSAANSSALWLSEENKRDVIPLGTTADGDGEPGDLALIGLKVGPHAVLATTTGTILFDEILRKDDGNRIGHGVHPFGTQRWMGKGGHLFVGPGTVCDVQMTAGESTGAQYLEVWDTDTADTTDPSLLRHRVHNSGTTAREVVNGSGVPFPVRKGCYVVMSPDVDADTAPTDEPSATFRIEPRYNTRATRLKHGLNRGYRSTA